MKENNFLLKIGSLLSFILIGLCSLLDNARAINETNICKIFIICIIAVLCIISATMIILSILQKDIDFKFNKKNKTLECINNSNHTMCISHTVYAPTSLSEQWRKGFRQKLDEEPKLNIIIPSGTKDIIFTSEESKAESSFTISYHFILPLPNDYCKSRTKIKIIKI